MIIDIYENLSAQRDAGHSAIAAAAADVFAIIAATMEAEEESGPPELYACYAFTQQEAIEGLAALGSQVADGLMTESGDAVEMKDSGRLAIAAPDLTEISNLAALTCQLLIETAPQCPDVRARLALLNAAVHAGQIRDLLAP